jgi:hypothetical protein
MKSQWLLWKVNGVIKLLVAMESQSLLWELMIATEVIGCYGK